jgi:hypothetical protein
LTNSPKRKKEKKEKGMKQKASTPSINDLMI